MFGTNQRIGKAYFNHLAKDQLMVTSAFVTLQGEGPLSGQRAVFLRLSKCLLNCHFCDTYFEDTTVFQFEDLADYLYDITTEWMVKNNVYFDEEEPLQGWALVVTGGEPMLQENLWDFIDRVEHGYLPEKRFNVTQIETTGTQPWKEHYSEDMIVVVSPKCIEKNGISIKYMQPHKTMLDRANCLKFVVSADKDSVYNTIPDYALEWKAATGKPIYVSPMNCYLREPLAALMAAKSNKEISIKERSEVLEKISFWESGLLDMEQNRKNHEWAAFLAMKYNCKLSLQTHLLASLP